MSIPDLGQSDGSLSESSFAQLAESRREWIATVLRPWCQRASHQELMTAAADWTNLAGLVDAELTLWRWAWSRFPNLVHAELGIDESVEFLIETVDGACYQGYADSRKSRLGRLVAWAKTTDDARYRDVGPWTVDDIRRMVARQR